MSSRSGCTVMVSALVVDAFTAEANRTIAASSTTPVMIVVRTGFILDRIVTRIVRHRPALLNRIEPKNHRGSGSWRNHDCTDFGLYPVVLANLFGSTTSSVAKLTVVTPVVNGPIRNADGSVTLSVVGLPSTQTRLWATTNLTPPAVWLPICTNSARVEGTWQFTDPDAGVYPARFCRFSTP